MKFKILFFLITFFCFNSSFADVLKPSVNIDPKQVVKIQLNALMKNDSPYKDRGIEQMIRIKRTSLDNYQTDMW